MNISSPYKDGDPIPCFVTWDGLFENTFPGLPQHVYALASSRSCGILPIGLEPMREVVADVFSQCVQDGCVECIVTMVMAR